MGVCMCGFCNVWVCVCLVMLCVSVLLICVLVFTVFLLFRLCILFCFVY